MKILGKTIGALAMGAALVSAIPAQARPGGYGGGGYHHGGGYGGYHGGYGGHRGYRGHGNDAGIAIGAGVLGLALGAIIASDHGDRRDRAYAPGYGAYQGGYQSYQGQTYQGAYGGGYDGGDYGYQGEDGYPY